MSGDNGGDATGTGEGSESSWDQGERRRRVVARVVDVSRGMTFVGCQHGGGHGGGGGRRGVKWGPVESWGAVYEC